MSALDQLLQYVADDAMNLSEWGYEESKEELAALRKRAADMELLARIRSRIEFFGIDPTTNARLWRVWVEPHRSATVPDDGTGLPDLSGLSEAQRGELERAVGK